MLTKQVKCAVIRKEGYPIGQSAPCYINCPCGAQPTMREDGTICFKCHREFDERGWIVSEA